MNDDKVAKDYNIEGGSVLHLVSAEFIVTFTETARFTVKFTPESLHSSQRSSHQVARALRTLQPSIACCDLASLSHFDKRVAAVLSLTVAVEGCSQGHLGVCTSVVMNVCVVGSYLVAVCAAYVSVTAGPCPPWWPVNKQQ
jgi:hypothetical protein